MFRGRNNIGWDILINKDEIRFVRKSEIKRYPLNKLKEIKDRQGHGVFGDIIFVFEGDDDFVLKTINNQFKRLDRFIDTSLTALGVKFKKERRFIEFVFIIGK